MANLALKELRKDKYWSVFMQKVKDGIPFTTDTKPVTIDNKDTRWSGVDSPDDLAAIFAKGSGTMLPTIKPKGTIALGKLSKDNVKAGDGKKGADAKSTAVQERGSAYILQRVLKNNKRYRSADDIRKDTQAYKALLTIWKKEGVDWDESWLDDYYKQQATMLIEYSNPRFTEFIRDGGFMKYITDLVKTKYQISQKDNWNPADIWLIKDQRKTIQMIESQIQGGNTQTLQELNAILRQLFHDEIVVGVSLKKISGKEAYFERINLSEKDFESYKQMYFEVSEVKIDLGLGKDDKGNISFSTQDARVIVDTPSTSYNFQIKANDSTAVKGSNLKWEPTAKGQSKARLGKAPVDMVQKLMIDYGIRFDNKHGQYPKSPKDFLDVVDDYDKMIERLKRKKVDTVVDTDTALNNISVVLGSPNAHVANSKLMQLTFLDVLMSMPKKKRNQFMTDMSFLAQKKGDRFGPFGKLY